jgi:DNA-binding transcriptional regulator YiaG
MTSLFPVALEEPSLPMTTTTGCGTDIPRVRQVVFCVGIAAAALTAGGTMTNAGGLSLRPSQANELSDLTSNGSVVVPDLSASPTDRRLADSVADLRRRSGLTWEEFARVFGVSRRAVHGWAAGARLNSRNAERLRRFGELVAGLQVTAPSDARSALMALSADGTTELSRFIRAFSSPAKGNDLTSRLGATTEPGHPPTLADRRDLRIIELD